MANLVNEINTVESSAYRVHGKARSTDFGSIAWQEGVEKDTHLGFGIATM
jgi:hypothetical protein